MNNNFFKKYGKVFFFGTLFSAFILLYKISYIDLSSHENTFSSTSQIGSILSIDKMIVDLQATDLNYDKKEDLIIAYNDATLNPYKKSDSIFASTNDDTQIASPKATAICWDYLNTWDAVDNTFTNCTSLGSPALTNSVFVAHTRSASLDDIVQFNVGTSYVYLNDGYGNFTAQDPQIIYSSPSGCDSLNGIVGDFNGDGYDDIAYIPTRLSSSCTSGFPVSGDLTIVFGSAQGLDLAHPHNIPLPNDDLVLPDNLKQSNRFNVGLAHGKINSSLYEDIVIGNFRSGGIQLLKNIGGRFSSTALTTITQAQCSATNPAPCDFYNFTLADVDKDGFLDLLTASFQSSQQSYIYYGLKGGSFAAGQALSDSGNTLNFFVADVNEDKLLDIVASKTTGETVYLNKGGRAFSQFPVYPLTRAAQTKTPLISNPLTLNFSNPPTNVSYSQAFAGFYNNSLNKMMIPHYSGCSATPSDIGGLVRQCQGSYFNHATGSTGSTTGQLAPFYPSQNTYQILMGGFWPGPLGQTGYPAGLALGAGVYVSFEFNTGDVQTGWHLEPNNSIGISGFMSVSELPGYFLETSPGAGVVCSGLTLNISAKENTKATCKLKANTTYYLNIAAVSSMPPYESTCLPPSGNNGAFCTVAFGAYLYTN